MIRDLRIENFKSIVDSSFHCKRVNVFIGEPNTGKSNILESLSLFSFVYYGGSENARSFVRFETASNLFYDNSLGNSIRVTPDDFSLELTFGNGQFQGEFRIGNSITATFLGEEADIRSASSRPKPLAPFKFYRFDAASRIDRKESATLLPPFGENLFSILLSWSDVADAADDLLSPYGLRIFLRREERKIEVLKLRERIIVSYPYRLMSETFQRLVFYLAAILTSKKSILILEEPEAHAFPYYTKHLAETIGLDENENQYFISTHNPYFLLPLIEKTPTKDLALFVVHFKDYQTKVRPLTDKEVEESLEDDIFGNLDVFLN